MLSMTDTTMSPLPTTASELLSALEPLSHCERWQYMLNLGRRCQSSISGPALNSATPENNYSSSRKSTSDKQADDATLMATVRRILCELAASDEYYETLVAVMGLRGMLATTITTKEEATTIRPTQVALPDDVRQACLRLLTQAHPDISTLACSLVAQTASEETLMNLLCENETTRSALNYATYASLVKAVQRSAEGQRVLSEAFRRVMRQTPTTLSQRAVCLACAIPTRQLVWGDKSHGSTTNQPHTALTTTASTTTTTTHDTASAAGTSGREEEQSVMQTSNTAIANEQKEVCSVAWWRRVVPQLSRGALCGLTIAHPEWITDTLRAALRAERQQYDNNTTTTAVACSLAEKPSTARSANVREDKEKKEEVNDDDDEEDGKASAEAFCVSRELNAAIVAVLQTLPRAHMHRSRNTTIHTTTTTRTVPSAAAQDTSEPPQTPCELGLVLLQECLPYLQRTQGNDSDDIVLQQLLPQYLRCCPRRVCHAILTRRDLPWPALRLTSTQLRTKLAHETDLLFALAQQGRIEDLPRCYRYLPVALRRRLYTTQRPLLVYAHARRHRYHDDSDNETNSNNSNNEKEDTQKKKSALLLPLPMSVLRHLPDSALREAEARAHWVAEMEHSAKDSRASERCAKYLSLLPYDEALDKLAPLRRSAELGTRITALRTLIGTVAYDATQLVPLLKYCVLHKAEQTAWHEALWSTLTSDVPLCVWAGQLRQNDEAWPLLSALLEHTLRAIDVAFGTLEAMQGFLTRRIAPVKPDVVAPLLLRLITCDEGLIEALRRQLDEMPTYTVPLTTTTASRGVVAADLFTYLKSTLTTWTERLLSVSASTTPASPPSSQQRLFALLDGLTASLARAVKARHKRHTAQAQSTSHGTIHTESSNSSAEEKALDAAKALYLACVNRFVAQAHDDAKGGSNDSETLRRMAEMALHAMTFLFRCWPQETRRTLLPRLLSSEEDESEEEEGTTTAKGHGSVSCGWVGMAEVRQVIERDMQGRWLDRYLGLWSCATLSCVPTAATTNPTLSPSSMPQRVSNAACSAFFAALRDRARADLADRRAKSALSMRTAQHLFTSLQTRYVPFSCYWARRWTAGQQRRYSHTLVHLLQLSQGVKSEEVDAASEGTSEPSSASEAASTITTSSDAAEPSLPSSQGLSLEQQRSLLRCLVRMPATVAEKDGLCALTRSAPDASASLVRDLALRLLGRRDDDVTAVRELLRALTDDRASQALFALRRIVRCDGLRRYGIALERDVVQAVLAHHKVGLSKELVRLLATLEESAEAYACLHKYFIAPAVAQFAGTGVTTTTTKPTIRDESGVAEQTHQPDSCVAASAERTTPNEAENVLKSPSSSGLHRDVLLALLTAVQQHQLGRPEVWQLYESVAQRPRSPAITQTSEEEEEEEDRRVEACKVISNVPDALLQLEWQRRRYYGGVLLQILQTYLPHTSTDVTAAQSSQRQTPLLIAVLQRLNRRDTPLPTDLEKAMQDTLLSALVTLSTHYTNDECYLVQCIVEVLLGLKCLPAASLAAHLMATQSDRMLQDMLKSVSDAAQYGTHSSTMIRRIRRVACSLVDVLVERRRQPTLAVQLLLQCLPCEQWIAKLQLLLDAKLMHKGACSEAVRCAEEVCEQEQNRTNEDEEPAAAKLEKEVLRQHSEPVLRRIGLAILVCIGNERGWSNSRRAALTVYQRDTDRWVSDDAMLVSVNDE